MSAKDFRGLPLKVLPNFNRYASLSQLGGTIMALNNRTKLGVTMAIAVLAGLTSVWIAVLILVLAALLIAWGQVPERTEAFVELLPGGNYLLKGLARIELLLWPTDLRQKDPVQEEQEEL